MRQDFPVEPLNNALVLKGKSSDLKIYYGTTNWRKPEWIGKLYSVGTRESTYLSEYSKHFNGIEMSVTHYKYYQRSSIEKWAAKTADKDFVFCPKFPQSISHLSPFHDIDDKTSWFLDGIAGFEKQLGPIYLTLTDEFKLKPTRKEKLFTYMKSLPIDLQFFLELRHKDWFDEDYEDTLKFLRDHNIGLLILDHPVWPLHLDLTVPKCFIRYFPSEDFSRLDKWFAKIKEWEARGLKEAYLFVATNDGGAIEQMEHALYFKSLVDKV
ncbi:DUF72 domain-containing protein [Segetibacter aerophilus]|uniref:DUF72 domain-containing protein n=1 Tax=Segetibacter aerophilus TaxID=670293 RepID=A0A512BA76_9BACT|nr:DUF72 domain-containing protein [Segetibacter aerophilus]GEO08737.1 hypothetical protein SAE01_12330 [Segetibacter aerophilus]